MKTENPQAFPLAVPSDCVTQPSGGMTLRDYFAAKAMQSIILHPDTSKALVGANISSIEEAHATISSEAFKIADAMLKERSKTEKS